MRKGNIKDKIISICCVVIIIGLIFGKIELYHYYPDNSYGIDSYSMEENKGDSIKNEIRIAQQKLDSTKRVERNYIDGFDGYSGWSGGFFGLIEPDQRNGNAERLKTQEYLMLSNIGLKIQDRHGPSYLAYYSKNGSGYISRTKLSTIGKEHSVSYVDKKVNYKYSSNDNAVLLQLIQNFGNLVYKC